MGFSCSKFFLFHVPGFGLEQSVSWSETEVPSSEAYRGIQCFMFVGVSTEIRRNLGLESTTARSDFEAGLAKRTDGI